MQYIFAIVVIFTGVNVYQDQCSEVKPNSPNASFFLMLFHLKNYSLVENV